MKVVNTIPELKAEIRKIRKKETAFGLVPTMGALHEGHISLIQKAREKTSDIAVSIFVNPTQFGPNEDFSKYPRTLEEDLEKCRQAGASLVFCPDKDDMYNDVSYIRFELMQMGNHLCGKSRPGHFNGVLQIVNKLFNLFKPDFAIFGQKDIQQFRIIEQMALEFNHDIEIIRGDTIRAGDGLALSSRNVYLNPNERKLAPALYQTLQSIRQDVASGLLIDSVIRNYMVELEKAGIEVDYLSVVSYNDLQPLEKITEAQSFIVAGAIYLGKTRLIDNIVVE